MFTECLLGVRWAWTPLCEQRKGRMFPAGHWVILESRQHAREAGQIRSRHIHQLHTLLAFCSLGRGAPRSAQQRNWGATSSASSLHKAERVVWVPQELAEMSD